MYGVSWGGEGDQAMEGPQPSLKAAHHPPAFSQLPSIRPAMLQGRGIRGLAHHTRERYVGALPTAHFQSPRTCPAPQSKAWVPIKLVLCSPQVTRVTQENVS